MMCLWADNFCLQQ